MIYHVLSVLKFNLDLSLRPSTLLRSSWGLEAARERERSNQNSCIFWSLSRNWRTSCRDLDTVRSLTASQIPFAVIRLCIDRTIAVPFAYFGAGRMFVANLRRSVPRWKRLLDERKKSVRSQVSTMNRSECLTAWLENTLPNGLAHCV